MINDPQTIARMQRFVGRSFKQDVPETPELHRILDLPRRVWERTPSLEEFTQEISAYLRTPTGAQMLWAVQAVVLQEAHDRGGLFGPLPVGSGKTLCSYLVPVVLEAKRPLLVVPARLRDKTVREFAVLSQHWKSHPRLEIVSYEKLSREGGTTYLQKLQPDLLILDECFPGDTVVVTEVGEIPIRDVVENGVGRFVLSRSLSGVLEWKRILRRFSRPQKADLVQITHERGSFVCTPEHKIWTERGYVEARSLNGGDLLSWLPTESLGRKERQTHPDVLHTPLRVQASLEASACSSPSKDDYEDVRLVSAGLLVSHSGARNQREEEILQYELLCQMALLSVQTDAGGATCEGGGHFGEAIGQASTVRPCSHVAEQPDTRSRSIGEDLQSVERSYVFGQRGEWETNGATKDSRKSGWASDGVRNPNCSGGRVVFELAPLLQSGSGTCGYENSYRGGREQSFDDEVAISRQAQDRNSRSTRVVCVEIQKRESLERSGDSCDGDSFLYDLEVEGNHNYFADGILVSNCHRLKNRDAAVTRKVSAWMKTFPETRVIAMSGTITKRSLLDFAHVLRWALPGSCPLPQPVQELEAWAAAVDEIKVHEQRTPAGPGALVALCSPQEKIQGREGIRSALRRRIQETPGVVAHQGYEVAASLNISLHLLEGYNTKIKSLARQLHDGVLPNGDVYIVEGKEGSTTALQAKWRIMRTLTSGFWYEWDPQPPKDWLELRSTWKKTVRRLLEEHLPGLESEALVTKAAIQKKLGAAAYELYAQWHAVKDQHKWRVVPVWEDDLVIHWVAAWIRKHAGLIWVSEVALGQRLEKELGLPYFHEMGRDSLQRAVETMDPADGSIVVSVASNSEGRNLQVWNENLIISPPPTGTTWEQVLGRSHRQGQEADEVWADVLIGCKVEWECWQQAMKDARYASGLEGPKKLTYATIDQTFRVPPSDGSLW